MKMAARHHGAHPDEAHPLVEWDGALGGLRGAAEAFGCGVGGGWLYVVPRAAIVATWSWNEIDLLWPDDCRWWVVGGAD